MHLGRILKVQQDILNTQEINHETPMSLHPSISFMFVVFVVEAYHCQFQPGA